MNRARFSTRQGLTLIELVVVLLILASIAAMVIARLGFVEDQAGNASTANAAADVLHNLEIYRTSTGNYPDRMDSLLENGGSDMMATHWTHPGGLITDASFPFEAGDINSITTGGTGWGTSIGHASVSSVMDYTAASNPPAYTERLLGSTASMLNRRVCLVKVGNTALERAAGFPNGLPVNGTGERTVRLVAFGIGSGVSMVGTTMGSAPSHSENNSTTTAGVPHYNRFIAIFAVYGNGKPMELRTVVDSFRSGIEANIQGYKNAAPTEAP